MSQEDDFLSDPIEGPDFGSPGGGQPSPMARERDKVQKLNKTIGDLVDRLKRSQAQTVRAKITGALLGILLGILLGFWIGWFVTRSNIELPEPTPTESTQPGPTSAPPTLEK